MLVKGQKYLKGNRWFPNPNLVGIDFDNILATFPNTGDYTYNVIEDCCMLITNFVGYGSSMSIDGVSITSSGGTECGAFFIFLKKGQVVSRHAMYDTPTTIYGLKY